MNLETQRVLLARAASHLANRTTDLAERCLRVGAEQYTSAAQLEREIRVLFRERPLIAALSPDLPGPGTYVTHEAGETPLVFTRADDGAVHAFINACRHRGTRVAEGRGSRQRLTCPFHAWTYDLEGRVCSRPMSCGGFDGIGGEFDRLAEVPCREVAGMIFVLLEGSDIDRKVAELVGEMRDEVAGYDIPCLRYFGSRATERHCNYKFIMDGFGESYHLKVLHKGTIAPYYEVAGLTDPLGPVVRNIGVRSSIEKELAKDPAEQRFPRHGTIHANLASGAIRELVFGRNEPALIHYHKQIARAVGGGAIDDIAGAC